MPVQQDLQVAHEPLTVVQQHRLNVMLSRFRIYSAKTRSIAFIGRSFPRVVAQAELLLLDFEMSETTLQNELRINNTHRYDRIYQQETYNYFRLRRLYSMLWHNFIRHIQPPNCRFIMFI